MKKLVFEVLFAFITLSVFSQTDFVLNREVPRAGEFINNTQTQMNLPLPPYQYLRGEDGYDSLNMSFQGNWPFGSPQDIISSITGDTVFIASGGGVMIMDVTIDSAPQLISEIRARGIIDHMYYDYATKQLYLAAYFSGFEIWDLSDISNPSRISRTPVDGLPRGGVYAYQNYLYVITVVDGIQIYDISDPANPVYVSTTDLSGWGWDFFPDDNFLYIRTYNPYAIRLYDLTNPTSPVLRDSYTTGAPSSIFVKDGLGYMSDLNQGLVIIDVSHPDNLTFVSSLQIPGGPMDVFVIDNHAYLANWWNGTEGGLYSIDVSDPSNPVQVDQYSGAYRAVTGANDKLTAIGSGYAVFDVSDPVQLTLNYEEVLPGMLTDVAVKGDYAFTGSNGFRVFDISDKSNPQQVAYVDLFASLVDISGDILAYIPESMGTGNRLSIMDISDPLNPYEKGHYSNLLLTQNAIIQGDYVYIAGWWDGFSIIDISDPTNPSFVAKAHNWTNGAIAGEEWCYVSDLDVQGNYVYLIDYKPFDEDDTKGLYIFDISDPQNPVFVSRYEQQSEHSWKIKVQGNYAYLGDGNGGVEIVDISNPQSPETVAYQELLLDVLYNLDVSNEGFVYAAAYINGGVQAIDISDPENPEISGYYYPTSVFALNVTADENNIYVCDGIGGIQIYNHEEVFTDVDKNKMTSLKINAYPNPSNGFINLDMENVKEVVVFDQAARFLKKEKLHNGKNLLDLSGLPNGVYFLKFKMTDGVQLQKIVISH